MLHVDRGFRGEAGEVSFKKMLKRPPRALGDCSGCEERDGDRRGNRAISHGFWSDIIALSLHGEPESVDSTISGFFPPRCTECVKPAGMTTSDAGPSRTGGR